MSQLLVGEQTMQHDSAFGAFRELAGGNRNPGRYQTDHIEADVEVGPAIDQSLKSSHGRELVLVYADGSDRQELLWAIPAPGEPTRNHSRKS